MADKEIGLKLKVKGSREAKAEIQALIKEAQKEAQAQGGARAAGGPSAAASGGTGGTGGGGRGREGFMDRFTPTAVGAFVGTAAANVMQRSFSALSQGLAQSFDPNMSSYEKNFRMTNAAAGAIPGVGPIAQAALSASQQANIGAVQGAAGHVNQILGPAFQAWGAMNPNAKPEDYEKRFGEQIDRLVKVFGPMERGRELGSQAVASRVDAAINGGPGAGQMSVDAMNEAVKFLARVMGDNTAAIEENNRLQQRMQVAGLNG